MARPNTKFDLSVQDMDLIEGALRTRKQMLSDQMVVGGAMDARLKDSLHGIQDLLGRLHNQKEFYRPKGGAYVSG